MQGHHALPCNSGLSDTSQLSPQLSCEFCSRACLAPELEKGCGIGFNKDSSCPADILVQNWSFSHRAAFDRKVIHPLNVSTVFLASLTSGSAAVYGVTTNPPKLIDQACADHRKWLCIPLVVEAYGCLGMRYLRFSTEFQGDWPYNTTHQDLKHLKTFTSNSALVLMQQNAVPPLHVASITILSFMYV